MTVELHPHVERAAMAALAQAGGWRGGGILDAVRAAVEEDRRIILDVVDVLAGQACCAHRLEPLNRILHIFGRDPVEGPTITTPDECPQEYT